MNKLQVAALLKGGRADSKLSISEAVASLASKGISISEKTLYVYEAGTNMPNAPTFFTLCDLYGIEDIFTTQTAAGEGSPLRPDEARLLDTYRALDDEGKRLGRKLLKTILSEHA